MKHRTPRTCPVCDSRLIITQLSCEHCQTRLEGKFDFCKFCRLPPEQLEFIEVFIKCRGNIKDVEKELRISYPTVRNRLDNVIESLGFQVEKSDDLLNSRLNILAALENGEITPQEALKQLRKR